jgi:outer membrane murein-binding lipoprotein Lpp
VREDDDVNRLGRWALLVALGIGVLAGCGSEEDAMDDREQLDDLAATVDGLAADVVPVGEQATGATVRSWRSKYRVCSDPTFTDVSYVVEVSYSELRGDRTAAIGRLVKKLEARQWSVSEPDDRGFEATRDGVEALLVAGPYGADLTLRTDCVAVSNDVGKEYGERPSRDFLEEG